MRRPLLSLILLVLLALVLGASPALTAETCNGIHAAPVLTAGLFDVFSNRSRLIQVSLVVVAIGCMILMKR